MFAQVVPGGTPPDKRDEMNRIVREMMVPALREEPGFRSALSLQDRKTGHGMFITFWTEEAQAAKFPTSAAFRTALGPLNFLILRGLLQFYAYLGDAFTVEYPTGSGRQVTLFQVVQDIGLRLTRIFLRDEHGRRPVHGGAEKFQTDPHWRDHLLFYEYFHGDNGAGIGASHQTGWTGLVARLIQGYALSRDGLPEHGSGPSAFLYGTSAEQAQSK